MTKQVHIEAVIDGLVEEVTDVRAVVLASRDGLAMASTIGGAEGSRVAAMAATVHALGNRVTTTTDLGTIEETVIRGDEMTFVVYDAGDAAVLALLAPGDCNLGMIHLEGRRAASMLAELLVASPPPTPSTPAPPGPAADAPASTSATNGTALGSHERDVESAPA